MFHFLALSEMTAARCTIKAIHGDGVAQFHQPAEKPFVLVTSQPTRASLDDPGMLRD
jgi:hypothetical protein